MKTITSKLTLNSSDMYLNIKVNMGGKTIVQMKANSLTASFLLQLSAMMSAGSPKNIKESYTQNRSFFDGNVVLSHELSPRVTFASVNAGLPPDLPPYLSTILEWTGETLRVNPANNTVANAFRCVKKIIVTKAGDYNGVYEAVWEEQITTSNVRLTIPGFTHPAGSLPSTARVVCIHVQNASWLSSNSVSQQWFRILGFFAGGSSIPTTLNDAFLYEFFEPSVLSRSGIAVGNPVISGNRSVIPITQTFTNVSGENLSVSEFCIMVSHVNGINNSSNVGILRSGGTQAVTSDTQGYMCRDVVPTFVVADAQTFSVTYEFINEVSAKSGILANFNELMYRQFTQSNRTVRNIFNENETNNQTSTQLFVRYTGYSGNQDATMMGIQVGTHTGDIDIDNFTLQDGNGDVTRIPHGTFDGSLYYLGTRNGDPGFISDTEGYIEFDAVFENRGSVNVNVNEVALTVRPYFTPVCISRHVLLEADRKVVEPGELLKVKYRIAIESRSE